MKERPKRVDVRSINWSKRLDVRSIDWKNPDGH